MVTSSKPQEPALIDAGERPVAMIGAGDAVLGAEGRILR
jgi:hypothetical protein